MKYEFHPAALQEYAEAVEFFDQYDNNHQDFINTIEAPIFRISLSDDDLVFNAEELFLDLDQQELNND